ncbi:MAG: helix-turn-helix transcriptional regulator [Clostridia bacterium]|nr:helix-turn-helix transcriptional regulator [Clostridia bacterium]
MTVGEKIQFYRKEKNLSQEQLGQMLFVSRQTVSLWEKDQTMPTIDNLLKL